MKKRLGNIVLLLAMFFNQSCIPPSTDQIKRIEQPNYEKIKEFGIEIPGEIKYQFYQKYGFTDLEEQLILIVKSINGDHLNNLLPIDLKQLHKLDTRKFEQSDTINFIPEIRMHEDIRLESMEFGNGKKFKIHCDKGKYQIDKSDSIERIYVYDSTTNLMYIESKNITAANNGEHAGPR